MPSALLVPASQRDDMVVTHVAARDPLRERAFASIHDLTAAGGYDALIDRDDIDLVYVALPPSGHCEWTIRALEAGKAVLCEKPFAMDAGQAGTMVAAAQRAGQPLIEAFHYRFHPTLRRAERLLREEAIGRLAGARANFCTAIPPIEGEFRWNDTLGGGAVMDLGCYPVHALRTLLGSEPDIVAASADYALGVEAAAEATLRFGATLEATLSCSMTAPGGARDLEIVGERGRLTISNFITPHEGGTLRIETPSGVICEDADSMSTYAAQLSHVADVVLRGAEPLTGGRDAVANMRAVDAIRATARSQAA